MSINVGIPGPQVRSRCQHPVLLEDVLIDFPTLTVIGAHMGHPYEALLIQYMLKWPQLHLMTSAYLATYMDPAIVRFMDSSRGRGRLLWASDHPVIPAAKALKAAAGAAALRGGHGRVPRRRRPAPPHPPLTARDRCLDVTGCRGRSGPPRSGSTTRVAVDVDVDAVEGVGEGEAAPVVLVGR